MSQSNVITWYPGVTLDNIEQMVIEKALQYYNGNKTATANALAIGVRTLHTKLDHYSEVRAKKAAELAEAAAEEQDFLRRSRGLPSRFDSAETIMELPSYKEAIEKRAAELVAERDRLGSVVGDMPARNPGPAVSETFKASAKARGG